MQFQLDRALKVVQSHWRAQRISFDSKNVSNICFVLHEDTPGQGCKELIDEAPPDFRPGV